MIFSAACPSSIFVSTDTPRSDALFFASSVIFRASCRRLSLIEAVFKNPIISSYRGIT